MDSILSGSTPGTNVGPQAATPVPSLHLFGVDVNPLRMGDAVQKLLEWARESTRRCRYVVTPNVDHLVMLQTNDALRSAYRDASLVLVDGLPVVWASRLVGKRVPERVAGSDLVPALFDAARGDRTLTVYLLGAEPGVADRAAQRIEKTWPAVRVVGTYSPPFGFEKDTAEIESILNRVAGVTPDVLVVGLGAPKQELWVHRHHHQLHTRVALCVGATIDFLAGEKKRAPAWMRTMGVEWCHRLCSEPRRLAKRYLRDAWVFPQIVWSELRD